ncbi:myosin-1 isoform X3 [Drosophila ananassae]|uniref:myosin-1 isoform X3 n=1 Tax=Drosophila ananassae TaxID=7217 RepID=UPI000177BC9D|nr:myosin-1 isoform X3 [Drosophila ananassae]
MDYYYNRRDVKITQLKNIELINNKKNAHKSALEMRTTMKISQTNGLDAMRAPNEMGATTWMTTLLGSHPTAKPKDHNSDTDSALSSAPPSISPQPPSSGSDSGVIWQTLQDLEKLQKEAEMYQKENERLQAEVRLLKQELEGAEQAALATSMTQSQLGEQMQRVQELEEERAQLSDECSELREQNELLEFRILELEDDNDKMESTCEGHCQSLQTILEKSSQSLEDRERRCLQQLMNCVQQLDLDSMMTGEQNHTESPRRHHNQNHSPSHNQQQRIVATVQPYSNCATPTAPPTPSKRHCTQIASWQSSSLSESGVFVECDLSSPSQPILPNHPHLLFYQERLEQLEGKLLIYESTGETQARLLAQRLQRELQLQKELKELTERVELLTDQNSQLDEAKCEFEEAENDTRLNLQRNEVELEILRQRNVELEFGKDALSAKYQDCRAEVVILREDLAAAETQLADLQWERKQAKKELQNIRQSLPLLLICRLLALAKMGNNLSIPENSPRHPGDSPMGKHSQRLSSGYHTSSVQESSTKLGLADFGLSSDLGEGRDVQYLKEEVKSLRSQLKELNARHYEAMETADSHWVDLEHQYKEREEAYRGKETSLKQKITQLQDCLREDSRAATEKIQQLEEAEQGLKTCLVRLTKEHRDLLDENRSIQCALENVMAKMEVEAEFKVPLTEALESEKKRSQALMDDLTFAKKIQQNTEDQLRQETDALRTQIFDIKKEYMHIEVTNGELKEEVGTLENKIHQMETQLKDSEERARCLEDELRTKDEQCLLMERKFGVIPEGFSLADELYDSPAKRAKKDDIPDLQTASQGLGVALLDIERRELELPTHKDFQAIACSVKHLADTLLSQSPSEVSLVKSSDAGKPLPRPEVEDVSWETAQDTEESQSVAGNELVVRGKVSDPGDSSTSWTSIKKSSSQREMLEMKSGQKSSRSGGGSSSQTKIELLQITDTKVEDTEDDVCKMPSTLRDLIYGNAQLEQEVERQKKNKKRRRIHFDRNQKEDRSSPRRTQRFMLRQFIYQRIHRTRVRFGGAIRAQFHVTPTLSINSFHSAASVHTVHSAKSQLSFHSQHADICNLEWHSLESASFAQTDPAEILEEEVQASPDLSEQEVQVCPDTAECGSQADVGIEQRLLLMPLRTRCFVDLLQNAVDGYFDVAPFRAKLLQLWEGGEDFREHIELLQDMWTEKQTPESVESYESFVAALDCVRSLKLALKPVSSALLEEIEQRINARLVLYHNQKMESEFGCTIYYPVKRPNSFYFSDSSP